MNRLNLRRDKQECDYTIPTALKSPTGLKCLRCKNQRIQKWKQHYFLKRLNNPTIKSLHLKSNK